MYLLHVSEGDFILTSGDDIVNIGDYLEGHFIGPTDYINDELDFQRDMCITLSALEDRINVVFDISKHCPDGMNMMISNLRLKMVTFGAGHVRFGVLQDVA